MTDQSEERKRIVAEVQYEAAKKEAISDGCAVMVLLAMVAGLAGAAGLVVLFVRVLWKLGS